MKSEHTKVHRREVILDAFDALVKRHGIDRITMQEIAVAVGVSVGTLYNEFANKEALIDALVDRLVVSVNKKISTLRFKSEAADERLGELLRSMDNIVGDMLRENHSLADYVLRGSRSFRYVGKKIHRDMRDQMAMVRQITAIIESGRAKGIFHVEDAEESAMAIAQTFSTYSLTRALMDEKEYKATRKSWQLCFALLIRGLKTA